MAGINIHEGIIGVRVSHNVGDVKATWVNLVSGDGDTIAIFFDHLSDIEKMANHILGEVKRIQEEE